MDNPLFAPVPEADKEAPAPPPMAYVGVVFAFLFEAIAGVSIYLLHAAYVFFRATIGVR